MLAALKSELRKLLSVRSTYVITLIGFLLVGGLMSFYGMGWMAGEGANQPQYMEGVILGNSNFMAIFISIVALLMVTHEFRYNTITYTLTSSNSRTKTLLAKAIVIGLFALVITAFISIVGPLLALAGMHLKGIELAPQILNYWDVAWRCLLFGFANAMFAVIMAVIIRNQVGTIMAFFIAVNALEGLLGILLKDNTKYLPFSAMQHIVNVTLHDSGEVQGPGVMGYWSPPDAALLVAAYLIISGVVAWLLFLKRDSN